MKRFIKSMALGVSVLSIATTSMAATFSDIKGTENEWSLSYVEDMVEQGLISGYPDGTYRPENDVSKLETISLFARAMGSRSEINASAVAYAMNEYADFLEDLDLAFGQEDVAFMLYRGVLTEKEATSYLSGDTKNDAMLRYEAATIITKAMGGEAEAKQNLIFDLEYTDALDIPSVAKKYVYYVTKNNIMSGGGDGTFAPNDAVSRAQIAVMLSKTVEAMELSFSEVTVLDIDTDEQSILLRDPDGEIYALAINDSTTFFMEGEKVQAEDIPVGVVAVVTLNSDGVVYVDVDYSVPDVVVKTVFNSYHSIEGVLYITATVPGSAESINYVCDADVEFIAKNGQATSVSKLVPGDYLELTISKDEVVSVNVIEDTTVIYSATIDAISYDGANPTITISHDDEEYDGVEFTISNNVKAMKGGEVVNMTSIYRGDKVTLTLEYGMVKEIAAVSTKATTTGTLRAINISSAPSITVLIDGEEVVYDVTSDIQITANGEEATLYDFQIGDKVTLTTESNAVIKIDSVTVQAVDGAITGTVVAVNSSYQFIKLSVTDTNGGTYDEYIYCKDTKTTFITADGNTKLLRDVKVGNTLMVFGAYTNGAFEAKSVIIVK